MRRRVSTIILLTASLALGSVAARAGEAVAESRIAKLSDDLASLQERLNLIRSLKPGDEFVFSTYILSDDYVGRTFMKEFAEAAQRGVKVRGIVDPSHTRLDGPFFRYLANAGVEVKEFHPMRPMAKNLVTKGVFYLNNRAHDKIWAVKRALPEGGHEYLMIEGSRNLMDSHFGLDAMLPHNLEPTFTEKVRVAAEAFAEFGEKPIHQRVRDKVLRIRDEKYRIGNQYRDLDFIIGGAAAQDVFEYHDRVFSGEHVKAREYPKIDGRAALEDKLVPEWVSSGHRELTAELGVYEGPGLRDPLRSGIPAKIRFYHDTIQGNVPQGSEQALIDGLNAARAGDVVPLELDGRRGTVPFTAELYRALEKTPVGKEIEIAGEKLVLTEAIRDAFAHARPADEVHMMSQYGILTRNLEKAFSDATKRGVTVKLLINGPESMWDGTLPVRGYEKTFKKLVDTGVQVMEYSGPEQIHAKVMTISNPKFGHENGITVTGSSNLDPRSLSQRAATKVQSALLLGADKLRNTEINYFVESPQFTHFMELEVQSAMSTSKTVAKGGKAIVQRDCPSFYKGLLGVPFLKNIL